MVRFVLRALARKWRLAACVAGTVLLITLVAIAYLPQAYVSEARFLVRLGSENQPQESEINSLLEVMRSRATLDRLVESLGPDFVLGGGRGEAKPHVPLAAAPGSARSQNATASPSQLAAPSQLPEASVAHERAVTMLEPNIEIWAPLKSNVIGVQCKASNAATAQQITARLVEVCLEVGVRVKSTAGSQQFLADQTRTSKSEWQAAAARLAEAKAKLSTPTINGNPKQLPEELADIDDQLLKVRSDLKSAEARIASLEQFNGKLPEKLVTPGPQAPNVALDNLRGTLLQLEAREQELAATRSDTHPQLMAVRQQLADLRHLLREQPPQGVQATQPVHPSRQSPEQELQSEQSQVAALRVREQSLIAQAATLRGELMQLNTQDATLGQLQQDVDRAEARYKADAKKLERSSINRSLDEERISSLTVVQPASFPTKAKGPRRAHVLALGLVVAITSGLGAALIAAYFQPLIVSREDLVGLWDLPLVGVVPAGG